MITLNAVGDIMLGGKVGKRISLLGADYLFENVRNVFSDSDFTIGNLECPLSDKGVPNIHGNKQFVFRASPHCGRSLKSAGFDIVCLANNHIMDYGPSALSDTIFNLKKNSISYIGAGNNLKEACRPLIFNKKGLKIAFLAYTNATNRAKRKTPGCSPCELNFMQKQVKSIKKRVDLVIVSIHEGIEYVDYPNRFIINIFRGLVDVGADLVLGHHPHVVQGLEIYKGSLIVYSLGNFISGFIDIDERKEAYQKTALSYFTNHPPDVDDMRTTESFILQCQLNEKGFVDYKLIPIKSNDEFQPVLMDGNNSMAFLQKIAKISEKFSNLNDPVFDEMDALWQKCNMYNMRSMSYRTIIKRIHFIRLRHLRLAIPYFKSKLGY